MSTIINLFGTGIRCWVSEIPMHRYNQLKMVAEFNKTTVNNIIFDLDVLGRLGYGHWKSIYPIKEINGFIIDNSNRIEIKNERKVVSKFISKDILGKEALFNLYSTKEVEFNLKQKPNYKYILIGQKETGTYKYSLKIDDFSIDKLCFTFCKGINKENSVVTLSYDGNTLKPKSEDTIVRSFFINYLSFK